MIETYNTSSNISNRKEERDMRIQTLTNENISYFIQYCNKYGKEHDESFLPNVNFKIRSEEPSFLLFDNNNALIGVSSLMDNGRFRILHSIKPDYEHYKLLIDKTMTEIKELDNIYLFLPGDDLKVKNILINLGFNLQRTSWYLERHNVEIDNTNILKEVHIKALEVNKEEVIWCDIINQNFKDHIGFNNIKVEDLKKINHEDDDDYKEMLLVWKDKKPIGTIQLDIVTEDGTKMCYISWLSINSTYRGLGIGRYILKHAIRAGRQKNAEKACLVVHSTNENALQLYLSEGFENIQSFECYNKMI